MNFYYNRIFFRDNVVVIAGHILIYMQGIVLMPLIIKTAGPTIYGGFVLLSSILGIVFGLSSLGAGFRAKRFLPAAKKMDDRRQLFYPQFIFGFLSLVLISIFLMLFNKPLNYAIFKDEVDYLPVIIPLYLLSYFLYSQGTDYFRYTVRVQYMTLLNIAFPYLQIGIVLILYFCFGSISVSMLILSMGASALMLALPCFYTIIRELSIKPSFYSLPGLFKDIKLGFPLVLNFIVDSVLAASDRYLIAFYIGVSAVGNYTPGYMLGSLGILIPKAMGTALPQLLSSAVDNDQQSEAETMLNYAIRFYLFFSIPVIMGTAILSKPLLTILANQSVAENSFLIAPIIAIATLFYGMNIMLSKTLFVLLKTKIMFQMNILTTGLNLVANIVLLYMFKTILVAAITTLASYLIVFICLKRIVQKEQWNIDFQPVFILKCIGSSLMMGIGITVINFMEIPLNPNVVLFGQILIGIIIYFSSILLLKGFSSTELNLIKKRNVV